MSLAELKEGLSEDNIFARYRSIRDTAAQQLPYESLCDEIAMIQAVRQARTSVHNMSPKNLLDVSLDEISQRARLTEILVKAKRASAMIQPVVDGLWHHITGTYAEELKSFRTKGERESAISAVLNKGYVLIAELDNLITQCELVIKEIDQTSFALSRIATLFELTIRHERLANVEV